MKKKIMASLLVGSAVVGASLAPLSAQAGTTRKKPVQGGLSSDDREYAGAGGVWWGYVARCWWRSEYSKTRSRCYK